MFLICSGAAVLLTGPFIVSSLRHTCAIITLSHQHLDLHAREADGSSEEVLTNTHLDKFVRDQKRSICSDLWS